MAGEYLIQWTDDQSGNNALKPRFTILPSQIDGPGRATTNTPLQLPGRYVVNYGELINENFVHLLENFSGPVEPAEPTSGMCWFDTLAGPNGTLKVRDKSNTKWILSGSGGGTFTDIPRVGGAGTASADFTAVAGSIYFVNTSTRIVTCTLPTTATPGDLITFTDEAGTWGTNKVIINNNGHKIMGLLEAMENDVQYSSFKLCYSGTLQGWRLSA